MNKKWNWNNPVTWKQSILGSLISMAICSIAYAVIIYGWDVKDKIDTIFDKVKKT